MDDKKIMFLTPEELAKRLSMKVGSLANWRTQGKGPKYVPGRPILYPVSEVEAWVKRNTVQSTSATTGK